MARGPADGKDRKARSRRGWAGQRPDGAPLGERRGFVPVHYLVRTIDDLIVPAELTYEAGFALAEATLMARGLPQ